MERALEQPVSKDHPGLEATVITHLAFKNMDEALDYLPQVRSGATQLSAYRSVGIVSVQFGATEEAISLAQQTPASIREDYFQAKLVTWTESDDEVFVDSIDQLPTAAL